MMEPDHSASTAKATSAPCPQGPPPQISQHFHPQVPGELLPGPGWGALLGSAAPSPPQSSILVFIPALAPAGERQQQNPGAQRVPCDIILFNLLSV